MARLVTLLLLLFPGCVFGQTTRHFADSVRKAYEIPELSYAVISADSIYEVHALGVKKINTDLKASLNDRFRIGSNTKSITGFVAAQLVKQGKISWDTKFFTLFQELKAKSRKEYHDLTLLNLLSMRTRLIPYTYTYAQPVKGQFSGSDSEQRLQFAAWFFQQEPVRRNEEVNFSNLGYVAAALMLEKVAGKPFQQLVADLGAQLSIDFAWGQPNMTDPQQTWGHNASLTPEGPQDNYKLNWLMAAGNINVTLPDYIKFIQLQLKGLQGRSTLLSKQEFEFLHFGLTRFSIGWFQSLDEQGKHYSWHIGNPGSFLTQVYIYDKEGRAFILFANAQTTQTEDGLNLLLEELKRKYLRQ
jgi:CubicO group peptidase (beta-lactamase class C family)